MVSPRSRKTRFKSKRGKVVFGHLFLSKKKWVENESIYSRRMFWGLTDYAHNVAKKQKGTKCFSHRGIFRRFWGVFGWFCDDKTGFLDPMATFRPSVCHNVAIVLILLNMSVSHIKQYRNLS